MRGICFYLPQYHPVPENDRWWGKGFTEWTNVSKTRPRFPGHYQPHLPTDLGFYDLRLPETRMEQVKLASEHGIYGFCYYHYWFYGRRILERPFSEVLKSGEPDFPFCLCWANENWSRRWDGKNDDVLLEQKYSDEDDLAHIKALAPAMRDERYIRSNNAAVFLVYRVGCLPNPKRFSEIWREEARKQGVGELYLCSVQSHPDDQLIDPLSCGFDAAVEFAPDWTKLGAPIGRNRLQRYWARFTGHYGPYMRDNVFDYLSMRDNTLNKKRPAYPWIRCCTPMWDNAARRESGATILINSSPEAYQNWLATLVQTTHITSNTDLVFINAWNEWAEGCHLEPCRQYGRRYLEATRNGLTGIFSTK
jgi:lipopolysaccharide biosynthesis protein